LRFLYFDLYAVIFMCQGLLPKLEIYLFG